MNLCKYQDCGRSERYRGYCQPHYYKMLYNGGLPRLRNKSTKTPFDRLKGRYSEDPITGCWIWSGWLNRGYAALGGRRGQSLTASNVMYEGVYGAIPNGMKVCHKCDNPQCIRPEHFFLGTVLDNVLDCLKKGRHAGQTGNNKRKISKLMAQNIRVMYARGYSVTTLSEIYPVAYHTLTGIVKGRTHLGNL